MSALDRVARRLARSDHPSVIALCLVPGLGSAIRRAAEEEYRQAAAAERAARGIDVDAEIRAVEELLRDDS